MKKLVTILFVILLFGCSGIIRHSVGTFDYIAIPQPAIENPTFSVYVNDSGNVWLKEQIETAIMHQNVTVLTFDNSKQFVTSTSGEGKSAAAQDNTGTTLEKAKVDVTTTAEFQSQVKSDYLFRLDYYPGTFSVISMKNTEIVAKGTFTSMRVDDIRSNINVILKAMRIIR